jgi:hypothetical protein
MMTSKGRTLQPATAALIPQGEIDKVVYDALGYGQRTATTDMLIDELRTHLGVREQEARIFLDETKKSGHLREEEGRWDYVDKDVEQV